MEKINLLEQQTYFLTGLTNQGKSPNTVKNYRTDLNIFNQFLVQKGSDLNLTEITATQLHEYQRFLEQKYNSPNSIRRRVQALRIFFDYLISQHLAQENPIKNMIVSPKVVDKPNPIFFPQIIELKAYLDAQIEIGNEHNQLLATRNLLLFYLIYGGGLKVSDIEKIKLAHINQKSDKYRVMIAHEKKDPYTITMPVQFGALFEVYSDQLERGKQRDQIEFSQLLFNANPFRILKGGLSSRGIEVIFKDLSKAMSFQITARNLRQSCIFKWIGNGVPLSRIKEWMGVQPQYSLKPFEDLIQEAPEKYVFMEL